MNSQDHSLAQLADRLASGLRGDRALDHDVMTALRAAGVSTVDNMLAFGMHRTKDPHDIATLRMSAPLVTRDTEAAMTLASQVLGERQARQILSEISTSGSLNGLARQITTHVVRRQAKMIG